MKRKISLLLLVALPFVSSADDFVCYLSYYSPRGTQVNITREISGELSEAFLAAVSQVPLQSGGSLNGPNMFSYPVGDWGSVSNKTTGAYYPSEQNPNWSYYTRFFRSLGQFLTVYNINPFDNGLIPSSDYVYIQAHYMFKQYDPSVLVKTIYSQLTISQIQALNTFLADIPAIKTDVSALVPLVESNKTINAGIASTVAGLGGVTNQLQSVLNNRLLNYTVDYDIPQIRDAVGGFRLLDPEQPTGDNTALMTYYYALRGLDFLDDQPGLVAQMVADGFATSTADATSKLTSNTFRASTLGPAVSQMRAKRDAIAKLKAAGMSAPPGGGSFDDMNLGELETLYQYSYNTPVSSNATIQAHALDQLKQIHSEASDAAGILSDIRNEVTGPQEVEVLNWPDDFSGLSVTLSNAFAEALANLDLNVSSEVWQLGRDYEEYRTYAAGVNPSYNAFFEDASFLAAPGPNDGKWWTESQNLLAYIAYYTASNRSLSAGILAQLTTNAEWIAASLAAASNNLAAIWGDNPRGWLDSKLSELQSGQTQLLDNFNSLTYFDGVGDIIDTYYQDVQQVPDTISFNTPFPISPSIDLRRMRGFLDLLHAATTLFLIGGWLICVPYIARWMFEHVNRMFDLFKQ